MTVRDDVGGLSFGTAPYTVKRRFLKETFRVTDADGTPVLSTERTVADGRTTFPFRDSDDEVAFRVHSRRARDVAGEYVLVDGTTNEPLLVLSEELSFRRHRWTIEETEGDPLATVTSQRKLVGAVNTVVDVLPPFPQRFSVTAPTGERIGSIAGRIDPRPIYDVRIERPGSVPETALGAGAVAIAVLEGV